MVHGVSSVARSHGGAATLVAALVWAQFAAVGHATVVRFNFSTVGSVEVRLFDSATPLGSSYFLDNVTNDRYAGTFIHQVPQEFDEGVLVSSHTKIQGGGFRLNGSIFDASAIEISSPTANEPGISNIRGTLAFDLDELGMPTNQWFFNLSDNPSFDTEGHTAFGRVLGDGMQVIDAIDNLTTANAAVAEDALGEDFDEIPVLDIFKVFSQGDVLEDDVVTLLSIELLDIPAGDYNFDGIVDLADYTVWRNTLGSVTAAEADGNGNGIVDVADYAVWSQTFGQTSMVPGNLQTASVPEPASCLLWAAGVGALLATRARLSASRLPVQ